jgi:hypothetical protein
VACRYPSPYWSAGGLFKKQNAAVREVMRNESCAGEGAHEFLSSRQRPTYTHYEFFAVWRATVAKFSTLTTEPPHARPLQSLMLDWIAVPDFLGGLSISVAAFTKYSNNAGFCNWPMLSKKGSWGWCHLRL